MPCICRVRPWCPSESLRGLNLSSSPHPQTPLNDLLVSSGVFADVSSAPLSVALTNGASVVSNYVDLPATTSQYVCLSGFGVLAQEGTFAVSFFRSAVATTFSVFDLVVGNGALPCGSQTGDANNYIRLSAPAPPAVTFTVAVGGTTTTIDAANILPAAGDWVHVAITVTASGVWTVYKDGAQVVQETGKVALPAFGAMHSTFLGQSQDGVAPVMAGGIKSFQVREARSAEASRGVGCVAFLSCVRSIRWVSATAAAASSPQPLPAASSVAAAVHGALPHN